MVPIILAAVLAASPAETPSERIQRLTAEAAEAMAGRNWRVMEDRLRAARAIAPNAPRLVLNLAIAAAWSGRMAEARTALADFAAMDVQRRLHGQDLLAPLLADPVSTPVVARIEAARRPQGEGEVIASLPGRFIAEGFAVDAPRRRILVSGVHGRTILQIGLDGSVGPFLAPDAAAGGVLGIALDQAHGVLWAAEASNPELPGTGPKAATALIEVDLASGRLLRRFPVVTAGKAQLNDVAIDPHGVVYVADAESGAVWRLRPGARRLDAAVPAGALVNPQGMAFARGGRVLLVSDYVNGLHRIDLASGGDRMVEGPRTLALSGIDGVVRLDARRLIVTQNGIEPHRVVELTLSPDSRRVVRARRLAAGAPLADDVSLAALDGNSLVLAGHSQWRDFDGTAAPAAPAPATVVRIRLPRPRS